MFLNIGEGCRPIQSYINEPNWTDYITRTLYYGGVMEIPYRGDIYSVTMEKETNLDGEVLFGGLPLAIVAMNILEVKDTLGKTIIRFSIPTALFNSMWLLHVQKSLVKYSIHNEEYYK